MRTRHDEIADKVVAQFYECTRTAQGTPLFKRIGETSSILRRLVVEALQEAGRED